MTCRSLVALVVVAVSTQASSAAAQGSARERASDSFRQAQTAFERGDFAAAAAAFEQAAQFEPHAAPLLDAADAWLRAGEIVKAAEDCDRAIAMEKTDPEHRAEAEACLRRLTPRLATLLVRGAPTDAISIDGSSPSPAPLRRRLVPGAHTITATDLSSSRVRTQTVSLSAGEKRSLDVQAPSPPPDRVAQSRPVPTSAWVAFGVALAAGAVAGTFGAMTLATKSDFDGGDHSQATADAFFRHRAITNVGIAVSLAAAATGIVLWTTASPRPAGASARR